MSQPGFTVWFTGLPFSGKKQLASMLATRLESAGIATKTLDGGKIRREFSRELGYSKQDVYNNIRRICFECQLLTDSGIAAIAVTISPFEELREECRTQIGRFIEVYCCCPLELLKKRDTKRLYQKAERGEITDVAGISAPYEEPEHPDVLFHSDREPPEVGLGRILSALEERNFIEKSTPKVLSDEEEQIIRRRLRESRDL